MNKQRSPMDSGSIQERLAEAGLEYNQELVGFDYASAMQVRAEFPALHTLHNDHKLFFFCGPGGSQVHESVIHAMTAYLNEANSNHGGQFLFSRRTDEITHEARVAAADFVNASRPEEIVFGPNMTTLTFRISQAIGSTLSHGDEIVVTRLDHDANVSPWVALQALGAKIKFVDFDPSDCTLDMDGFHKAITPRTKVVAVGYASNAVGTINDVQAITNWAHEVGALVYVDAVHFAPHGPIDVAQLDCDFLACSAYKFFGPHLGLLYGKYELLDNLPALKVIPAGDLPPDKFETGTNNFEAIAGANAAIDYLASVGERFGTGYAQIYPEFHDRRLHLKTGMTVISRYERALCERLVEGLSQVPEIRIYGITDKQDFQNRVPTVSFTSECFDPAEIARKLDERGIFVWNGHFYAVQSIERLGLSDYGGLVRVGICHYNTAEEVDYLVDVMKDLIETR